MPRYYPTARGIHRPEATLAGAQEEADSPEQAKELFEAKLDAIAAQEFGENSDENSIVAVTDVDTGVTVRFD